MLPEDATFLRQLEVKAQSRFKLNLRIERLKVMAREKAPKGDEVPDQESHGLVIPDDAHVTEGPGGIADSLFGHDPESDDE